MTTLETAQRTATKYFVEFVTNYQIPGFISYYALVRTSDAAYLYANAELDNIWLYCFHAGISKDDITLW